MAKTKIVFLLRKEAEVGIYFHMYPPYCGVCGDDGPNHLDGRMLVTEIPHSNGLAGWLGWAGYAP